MREGGSFAFSKNVDSTIKKKENDSRFSVSYEFLVLIGRKTTESCLFVFFFVLYNLFISFQVRALHFEGKEVLFRLYQKFRNFNIWSYDKMLIDRLWSSRLGKYLALGHDAGTSLHLVRRS